MTNLWQRFCYWLVEGVVPEPTAWTRLMLIAQELQVDIAMTVIEALDWFIDDIARCFGAPPDMLEATLISKDSAKKQRQISRCVK